MAIIERLRVSQPFRVLCLPICPFPLRPQKSIWHVLFILRRLQHDTSISYFYSIDRTILRNKCTSKKGKVISLQDRCGPEGG